MPPRDEIRYFGNHIYEASTAYDADWWENVRQFADVHHYDIDDLIGKWAEWRAVRFGFAHVCREGNVAEAKRYGEVYKLDLTDMRHQSCYAFYLACMAGHLDMAQWLAKTLKMTYSDATKHDNFIFRRACGHGYLQLAQWLVAHFGMESPKLRTGGNEAFNMACVNGHSHVVTWLVKIAELDPVRDRFDVIIENCYLANQEAMAVWLQSLLFSRRNA